MVDKIQRAGLADSEIAIQSAMTKAEFFALAEKCKRDSAGSGFLECGSSATVTAGVQVNQGFTANSYKEDRIYLGTICK